MLGFTYLVGGPVKSCFLLVLLEPKTFYCAYLYVIVIDIKRRTFEKIKVVVHLFFVESWVFYFVKGSSNQMEILQKGKNLVQVIKS